MDIILLFCNFSQKLPFTALIGHYVQNFRFLKVKMLFLPLLDASYRNVIKTNVLELKHLGQVITDTFFIGATVLKKTLKN